MISSSINWCAGGFCEAYRRKSVSSHTAIQNSLNQKITSSYLPFHREKMGSHLLVETSRNPECPKVSLRRWSDSFFPLVLLWHWPMSLCLTLFSEVLKRKLLSLFLPCISLHDKQKGNAPKSYRTVMVKMYIGFHMLADSSEAHRTEMILN